MPRTISTDAKSDIQEAHRWEIIESLRLEDEPDRIRFSRESCVRVPWLGTVGACWQIHYRDEWRELPWHNVGPGHLTRDDVRHVWGTPGDDGFPELGPTPFDDMQPGDKYPGWGGFT